MDPCSVCGVLVVVVVVTVHGASEDLATDCRAAETLATDHRVVEIFRDSMQSSGGVQQQVIEQRRTAVTDHGAADTSVNLNTRIARALFAYRPIPQSTTGGISAELLLGWKPCSRLDLTKLDT